MIPTAEFESTVKSVSTLGRLFILVATCGGLSAGLAQPPAGGKAIFFTEPGYKGESFIVTAGNGSENLSALRDRRGSAFNDRVASIRFEGAVRVAIFEHPQFRGAFTWINRDTPDLAAFSLGERSRATWNEAVSSLQVETVRQGTNVFTAWDRRDAERAVRAAYRDFLGREADPEGLRFYSGRLLEAGWSHEQLKEVFRRSTEFRERDLGAIIRRVYLDELGREPDPSGIASYSRGLSRGMTESEFRVELRRSREGAEHRTRSVISRAYREVLRREPDPAGLETYLRLMLDKGWDDAKVRAALRSGDEFRNLPR